MCSVFHAGTRYETEIAGVVEVPLLALTARTVTANSARLVREARGVQMSEDLLGATVRLTSSVEALAALAAYARIRTEGMEIDPEIEAALTGIANHLLGDESRAMAQAPQAIGMSRAFLRESLALVDDPARVGGWSTTDVGVLQGVGRLSMAIAPVIAGVAPGLPGLATSLAKSGASILDIGTGTGWLAIALARTFPNARVTGIDIYETSLELARANVAAEGLSDRVTLELCDVTKLARPDTFDAVWLPLPFLPREIIASAIERSVDVLRPGGWLLPGTFAGPDDELSQRLLELRILRSGGHPWKADELIAMMADSGLTGPTEIHRNWNAPVRLFAGRTRT